MLSSVNAQDYSLGNRVYSTAMPNLILLIWSSSCLRTSNGKCLSSLHTRWTSCWAARCSRKNWANDLPHMWNSSPQLNVYSRIWMVTSTTMVLRSSCLGSTNVYKKMGITWKSYKFCSFSPFWIFQQLVDKTSWLSLI